MTTAAETITAKHAKPPKVTIAHKDGILTVKNADLQNYTDQPEIVAMADKVDQARDGMVIDILQKVTAYSTKQGIGDYVVAPVALGGKTELNIATTGYVVTPTVKTAYSEAMAAVITLADEHARGVLEALSGKAEQQSPEPTADVA